MHLTLAPFMFFFFFNDTATTEIYTLSLHDALPILILTARRSNAECSRQRQPTRRPRAAVNRFLVRSEEHTSELQSRLHLVCRLLLEKKKFNLGVSREFNRHTGGKDLAERC